MVMTGSTVAIPSDDKADVSQRKPNELNVWQEHPLRSLLVQPATYGVVKAGKFLPSGVPMMRGGDIKNGRIISTNLPRISFEKADEYRRTTLRHNDVVIALVGYPGEAAEVPSSLVGANISRAVGLLRPSPSINPKFLVAFLNSPIGRAEFLKPGAGSAQLVVNLRDLNLLKIPLPDPEEQRVIAESLTDSDSWIASLEELIEKKHCIKQGAMQELLSGRRRLPTFSGEWAPTSLGARGAFFKGSGIRRDQAQSGELPCVRYGELYTHHEDVIHSFHSKISPAVATTAQKVARGDILFAGSGETKGEIGKCAVLEGAEYAYAGGDIIVFRPRDDDPIFLAYYLNSAPIQAQKAAKGQGDAVVHISARALSDLEFLLPCREEQKAIAQLLLSMDSELESLEIRLEKARQIKHGMMQELLTGRVRLL